MVYQNRIFPGPLLPDFICKYVWKTLYKFQSDSEYKIVVIVKCLHLHAVPGTDRNSISVNNGLITDKRNNCV